MTEPTIVNGEIRAARDGSRPAAEEMWFCPSCGKPARCFVSFYRLVMCDSCGWTFNVELRNSYDQLQRHYQRGNVVTLAELVKLQAEQEIA